MKIRWKLMILLLGIALLPLATASLLDRLSTRRLGHHLAAETRGILTEQARLRLLRIVRSFGLVLQREQALLETAVHMQAQAVEARLGWPPPARPRVFFAEDIDSGLRVPEGMAASSQHVRIVPGGAREPLSVSYREQVYSLAPGADRAAVAGDVGRLATMTEVFSLLHGKMPQLMYWQYVALGSGVHVSYPAHGGYPADFDPRTRPWYVRTMQEGGLTWLPPYTDATTGAVMLTVALPLRLDGNAAGVTAIDVRADSIFRNLELPTAWVADGAALLVYPTTAGDASPPGHLAILARKGYHGPVTHLTGPFEMDVLRAEDPNGLEALRRDALSGEAGTRQMPYLARPAMWAHGSAAAGKPFPLVIVPQDRIVARAVEAENYVLDKTIEGLQVTGVILLAVIAAVVAAAFLSSRSVTRPIHDLAEAAERLGNGDYDARVDIHTHDELESLARRFNDLGPTLQERERMKRSLHLAMEIQQHLLPQAPPELEGFDLAGHSVYCDETGGDYYDFIELLELGPGKLGIAVGDVTGHGIAAALLMASARAVLRSQAGRYGADLGELFASLNRHLVRDTGEERFITLFYGVLDAAQRALWWTSGGHDPPLWLRRATGRIEELPNTGIPLGVMEDADYPQAGPVTLAAGDIVVIGTDGIWEAQDAAGEMFGKKRLRELLARTADRGAREIYDEVVRAVNAFRGPAPQTDDITLVVIKAL
ncbi:MAG TPA: SpoIIE family protein phosphatase [Phycisphaerae bacterium]|nr:SpoIIE family protein phosphatase [Phycisphaerae bacterium]